MLLSLLYHLLLSLLAISPRHSPTVIDVLQELEDALSLERFQQAARRERMREPQPPEDRNRGPRGYRLGTFIALSGTFIALPLFAHVASRNAPRACSAQFVAPPL